MLPGKKNLAHRIFPILFCCLFFLHTPAYAVGLLFTFDNDGGSGDGDWNNPINWLEDALPDTGDDVILTAGVDSNSGLAAHVASFSFTGNGHLNIPVTVDGGATFLQDASLGNSGTLFGDATFVDNSFNDGTVTGMATFNDSAVNYGTIIGDVVFNGSNINRGTISGNALFRDSSYNAIGSIISGNADFYDVSYNAGTVSGDAKFHMYTAVGSEVSISGDTNFHGTGIVGGIVLDSVDMIITRWQLTNSSRLNNGFLQGNISLSDMSQNFGTVSGNAVFQNSADNSGGIVQWNATFQNDSYNGGIVLGNAIFYDASRNQWAVNGDATYMLYTAVSWVVTVSGDTAFYGTGSVGWRIYDALSSAIHDWVLDSGTILSGTLKGDAIFHDTSINNGIVEGDGTFQDASINNGTIQGDGYFASPANNATGAIVTGSINPLPVIVSWGGGSVSGGGGGGSTIIVPVVQEVIPEPLPPAVALDTEDVSEEIQLTEVVQDPGLIEDVTLEDDAFISLDPAQSPLETLPEPVTPAPITVPTRRITYLESRQASTHSVPSLESSLTVTSLYPQYVRACQLLVGTDSFYIFLEKGICDILQVTHPILANGPITSHDIGGGVITEERSSRFPFAVFFIMFLMLNAIWFVPKKNRAR